MKKSIKTVISFMTVVLLIFTLSSCTLFENMKQNALLASQIVIEDTPADGEIINVFNSYLKTSMTNAVEVKENVSYSAGSPEVLKGEEEAGLLDAAANQLKTFIMSANPGSTSRVVDKDTKDSLLNAIDKSFVLKYDFSRNIASENVTDDKGENKTDDDGNNITETHISDNVLHITLNYFKNVTTDGSEPATNEEGNVEEETTVIYAEDATIETVFGSPKDKAAVLKNFENVKDYIVVSDYAIDYTNCIINTDLDLSEGTVTFVNFQKNMTVTANIKGVGALAEYGDMVVTFTLVQNTNYEFTYDVASEEDTEETTAKEEATTEEESAETTVDVETTDVETTDVETTVDNDTTVDEETTVPEETTAA